MADRQKYFDLHIECGLTTTGDVYVRTILGSIEYRKESSASVGHAMMDLVDDLHKSNIWNRLAQNPQACVYPFPGTQTPLAISIDPNAPKKRPSDLSQVKHPACQMQCTSFDLFGAAKCKSMCRQRSGV